MRAPSIRIWGNTCVTVKWVRHLLLRVVRFAKTDRRYQILTTGHGLVSHALNYRPLPIETMFVDFIKLPLDPTVAAKTRSSLLVHADYAGTRGCPNLLALLRMVFPVWNANSSVVSLVSVPLSVKPTPRNAVPHQERQLPNQRAVRQPASYLVHRHVAQRPALPLESHRCSEPPPEGPLENQLGDLLRNHPQNPRLLLAFREMCSLQVRKVESALL